MLRAVAHAMCYFFAHSTQILIVNPQDVSVVYPLLVEYHVVVHSVEGPVVSAATSEKTEVYPGYLREYPNLQVLVHRQ